MYQSGFRTNHSKDFWLVWSIDIVFTGMDKQMLAGIILVDLKKTFDTLDHDILREKQNALVSKHL